MRALGFAAYHPVTQLLYFAAVLTLSLLSMDPIIITMSIAAAIAANLYYANRRELRLMLRVALPLFLFVALANPIVSHRGRAVLFTLFGQAFTLEALLYGAVSGLMLAAVLLWFCAFSAVVNNDRLRYLFGRAAPTAALVVTMTLRLIPLLLRRQNEIDETLSLLSPKQGAGGRITAAAAKAKRLSGVYTVLLATALEDSLDTARSMSARGYGAVRRTHYEHHRFKVRDMVFLACLTILFALSITIYTDCNVRFAFYPVMTPLTLAGARGLYYLLFALQALLPLACEGWEVVRWRS